MPVDLNGIEFHPGDPFIPAKDLNRMVAATEELQGRGDVSLAGNPHFLVIAQAAIAVGASGNVKRAYYADSAFSTIGNNIEAVNIGPDAIPSGGKAIVSGSAGFYPVFQYTAQGTSPAVGDEKRAYRTDDHITPEGASTGCVWKLLDGRTIGDASSGAGWASADAEDLFVFLYDKTNDTNCPILTSGGGATTRAAQGAAATAWAAHCRLTIPDSRGDTYGPRYLTGAGGTGPAVAQTGGDYQVNPGGTIDTATTGVTVDSGTANITTNSEEMFPYPTEECTQGYIRVYDAGHTHGVTDAGHTHGATNLTVDIEPRYLAAGVFILAQIT